MPHAGEFGSPAELSLLVRPENKSALPESDWSVVTVCEPAHQPQDIPAGYVSKHQLQDIPGATHRGSGGPLVKKEAP
eukprot:1180587-Prorocentrum_minimum.AAC.7